MLMVHKYADKSGEPVDGVWPLDRVELEGTPPKRHDFSVRWVLQGVHEGWVTEEQGTLLLHLHPKPLRYKILEGVRAAHPFYTCELEN